MSLLGLVLALVLPFSAVGQESNRVNGLWVIDPDQTAAHIIKKGPPERNPEWIAAIVLRMCISTLIFDDENLTVTDMGNIPAEQKLRLKSKQGSEPIYVSQSPDGAKDTWTISFLGEKNIVVQSSNMGLMEYGVWKRSDLSSPQRGESAFTQAFSRCRLALEKVPFIKSNTR